MLGVITETDKTLKLKAKSAIPDRPQGGAQGPQEGRDGHQVRRGHRPHGRRCRGGRARARAQPQDQALVKGPRPDGNESERQARQVRQQPELPRLAARERPRRRAQPRRHPAARRPVECGLRGRRQQHQGHAGHSACLWPPAVRRRPRPVLPHADRHRLQPQRRRRRRHRHRGRLDRPRGRRHRQDRQAGGRLRHRGPRRHRHHRQGLAQGQGVPAVGLRARARGVRDRRPVGVDQVRRERHDDRARLLPDGRQHVRQADPQGHLRRASARPRRSPAPSTSPSRAPSTPRSARSGCACSRPISAR